MQPYSQVVVIDPSLVLPATLQPVAARWPDLTLLSGLGPAAWPGPSRLSMWQSVPVVAE